MRRDEGELTKHAGSSLVCHEHVLVRYDIVQ